jgi:AsmA protein
MTGAGTVDLGSKMLAFRVEPKLVMTTEGQGGSADPIGLGIPVIVQGTWGAPRIYPDMAGILDNPDAAYAKLRELGQGLFGQGGIGSSGKSDLGETLGTLIQQGLGGGTAGKLTPGPPAPGQPAQGQSPQGGSSPLDDIMKRLFGR